MARVFGIGAGYLFVASVVSLTNTAYAGKLDDLRDRTDAHDSGSNDDDGDDDDDDDDCNWLALLLGACGDDDDETTVDYSPSGPPKLEPLGGYFFLPYPYAEGNWGNSVALLPPRDSSIPPNARLLRDARWQLFADVGQDTDGLRRGTLGLSVDTNRLWGLDTRWTYWVEQLPSQQVDALWLGDANLRLLPLTLPNVQLAIGLGMRMLSGGGNQVGTNGGVNLELYPVRPLVMRVEADVGNLGPAMFWESQGTLGVVLDRYELYAGAAHFQVQDIEFDSAFAGLRIHL
jgi:hypothetical protein